MRKFIIILFLLSLSASLFSQSPRIQYDHRESTAYDGSTMLNCDARTKEGFVLYDYSTSDPVSFYPEISILIGPICTQHFSLTFDARTNPLFDKLKGLIKTNEWRRPFVIVFQDSDELLSGYCDCSITSSGAIKVMIPWRRIISSKYNDFDQSTSDGAIQYHRDLLLKKEVSSFDIDVGGYGLEFFGEDSNSSVLFKALFDHVEEDFKTYGVSQASHSDKHEYVDLGLSVKWATCNIGATKPEEFGDYFAWAEISTKKDYLISNNKYILKDGDYTKYSKYNTNKDNGVVDNLKSLTSSDDAAHYNWGGAWHIPTLSEWQELYRECTWKWTTVNGVKGYQITSQKTGYTGKSIFLPAAGFRLDSHNSHVNSSGFYWSSSLYTDNPLDAFLLDFNSKHYYFYCINRFYGVSIRPVRQ